MNSAIAIVGLSTLLPGAPNAAAFYNNILTRKCSIAEADDDWLQNAFSESSVNKPGRIRSKLRAGLADIAFFDPLRHGIMPKAVDGGDPDHYLSLRIATEALEDSRLPANYDHTSTGVVVGRGTYFNRGFGTVFQHGIIVDQTVNILKRFLDSSTLDKVVDELVRSLPDFNSDMVGGVVPNIVSGRIANKLGLGGPNFLIDAACASSLIAVEHASEQLALGKADLMLVGGVQASTPPQVHMVFDLLDALAREHLTPFSKNAQGTVLSEGVGFVVLCRLADAERLNLRVYATIQTVGSSSDGRGKGLFAPSSEGQQLAIQRAYEGRQNLKAQVRYLETHGTGMPLGDETELRTVISQLLDEANHNRLHLGNLKSLIGHCIPASGIAGLISASLAVKNGIFPAFSIDKPIDLLKTHSGFFQTSSAPQPWLGSRHSLRTAAVNAFGFGGINSHLVVQQHISDNHLSRSCSDALWPSAIFFFAADTLTGLIDSIGLVIDQIREDNFHRLSINSLWSAQSVPNEVGRTLRGFVVASGLEEARNRLIGLRSRLERMSTDKTGFVDYVHRRNHTVARLIRHSPDKVRPVFVYPGEGSQSRGMLRELSIYFPIVNTWMSEISHSLGVDLATIESILSSNDSEQQLPSSAYEINISTGLVFAANMSINQLLLGWGICPAAHLGHSTGQNSSLFAGSWLYANCGETILQRACSQVSAMRNAWAGIDVSDELDHGYIIYILQQPDADKLDQVCAQYPGNIIVSMRNCPEQYVVAIPCGLREAVEPGLRDSCVLILEMPIKRPYHTKYFQIPSNQMRQFYEKNFSFNKQSGEPVYSCTSGSLIESAHQARHELSTLMESPVNFEAAVRTMIDHGYHIYLECGHGSTTANFIRSISKFHQPVDVISTQNTTHGGLESFLHSIGFLWSFGNSINSSYIEEQAQIESAIANGFIKDPKEVNLNLLMPRARLSDACQALDSVPAPPPLADKINHSNQNSPQIRRVRHQGSWISQVTMRRDTPVLMHHTLPNRSEPSDGIRAEGVFVVPMALFTSLAISTAIKATGADLVSLSDLKMSRWAEAGDLNEFVIHLISESSKGLTCHISHNNTPILSCAITPASLTSEPELYEQDSSQFNRERKPYFWPSNELYLHGMFHGPFYQVIKDIDHCDASEIEGVICTTTNYAELNTVQILDGIAQAFAFWAAPGFGLAFHTFPIEINHLKVGVIKPSPTRYTFRITNTRNTSSLLGFDGIVLDEQNIVVLEFKQFLNSLVRLPQSYHSCFADCEFAYFSKKLGSIPNEICISIADNAQALGSYRDPNGFFSSIFRHMWFNDAELKSFGESSADLPQLLMLLNRKECVRYLLEQRGKPVQARNVIADLQGNVFYVDTHEKRMHQLPTPVTLYQAGQLISIVSFTHRVSLVHVSQTLLDEDDAQPDQARDESSNTILKCIDAAIRNLFGMEIDAVSLENVKVLNQATISATCRHQPIMAGALRLCDIHYGWAAVKSIK